MSIRVLWSGPESIIKNSERFEIRGTAKALAGLGRLMCELTSNTMIKTHGGYGLVYPMDMPGLKLMFSPKAESLIFGEDAKALRIEANAQRFSILGQSLINSYTQHDLPGHSFNLRAISGGDETFLAPTPAQLGFTSTAPDAGWEPSGWFGETP